MLCALHAPLKIIVRRGVSMDDKLKWTMILNGAVFSFIIAITSPTVHLYFVQRVDPQVYVAAGIIGTTLAALLSSLMSKENIRKIIRKVFSLILLLDSFGFAFVSLYDVNNISFRFIGLAVLSSISMTIWCTVMMDALNHKIKDTELTNFQTTENAFKLWANVIGGGIAMVVVSSLRLEQAIWMQCIANGVFAFVDWKAYNKLKA